MQGFTHFKKLEYFLLEGKVDYERQITFAFC